MKRNGRSTTQAELEPDMRIAPELQSDLTVSDGTGILSALRHLWEERSLIAKVTAVGLCASLVIALLIPKTYKSSVELMPPDSQDKGGLALLAAAAGGGAAGGAVDGGGLGAMAGDLLGLKSTGALFMGELRSRNVQDALINEFDLRKVYGVRYWEQARTKLRDRTSISEDRKSGIVTIEVIDRDPNRATAMAGAYVKNLNRVVTTLSTSSARREREFLEQRLKTVQADLEKAQKDFSEFSSKNSTLDIKEQAKAMVEGVAMLQGQLVAAQSELGGVEAIYADNNVRVRSLKGRIAELQSEIKKMGGTVPNGTEPPNIDGIPTIRQLPIIGVQFADLYRQVRVQETVYEVLTKQCEMAKVQEAKEIPPVKVLDAASIPEHKAGPPRAVLTIFGTLITALGCCCWILLGVAWRRLDDHDERKLFMSEIWLSFRDGITELIKRIKRDEPKSF